MSVKNRLIYRIHDRELERLARRHFRGRLVDIGCGTKPYLRMMASIVSEHVGVDRRDSPHGATEIDLAGTAYEVPAEADSFDSALCTSVLEHLEEPAAALRECWRVLKRGGVAIYSVPFLWHIHEAPRDFFRFTEYGLRYLFVKAGFEILELKALSGFFTTFGTLLGYYLYRLNRGPLRWLRLIDVTALAIQGCAWMLDCISRDERYTWMYMVAARKGARA